MEQMLLKYVKVKNASGKRYILLKITINVNDQL